MSTVREKKSGTWRVIPFEKLSIKNARVDLTGYIALLKRHTLGSVEKFCLLINVALSSILF
jgi:hypothetical protein